MTTPIDIRPLYREPIVIVALVGTLILAVFYLLGRVYSEGYHDYWGIEISGYQYEFEEYMLFAFKFFASEGVLRVFIVLATFGVICWLLLGWPRVWWILRSCPAWIRRIEQWIEVVPLGRLAFLRPRESRVWERLQIFEAFAFLRLHLSRLWECLRIFEAPESLRLGRLWERLRTHSDWSSAARIDAQVDAESRTSKKLRMYAVSPMLFILFWPWSQVSDL